MSSAQSGIKEKAKYLLGDEILGRLVGLHWRQARLLPTHLSQLKKDAVKDTDQHLAGSFPLRLGHIGLHEVGNRLQPSGWLCVDLFGARLGPNARIKVQGAQSGCRELGNHIGAMGRDGLGPQTPDPPTAHLTPGKSVGAFIWV